MITEKYYPILFMTLMMDGLKTQMIRYENIFNNFK